MSAFTTLEAADVATDPRSGGVATAAASQGVMITRDVVNRVVDSLDVRISRNLEPSVWLASQQDEWARHREDWSPDQEPLYAELPLLGTFRVLPDHRPYQWKLVNPSVADIRIWNPSKWASAVGGQTGQLYVSFRSRFLQEEGTDAALRFLDQVVEVLMGGPLMVNGHRVSNLEFDRVSRGDLAVDRQVERGLSWDDLGRFVCRAKYRDGFATPYSESAEDALRSVVHRACADSPPMGNKGGHNRMREAEAAASTALGVWSALVLEDLARGRSASVSRVVSAAGEPPKTVYFSKFTAPIYCRIYDKLASLPVQGKLYLLDTWLDGGWDGVSPVWRTEFSISGDFLRAFKVEGVEDAWDVRGFLEAIPAIWRYATQDWLRFVVPTDDKDRDRWPNDPTWDTVAGAWPIGVGVRVKRERKPDTQQLLDQAVGCLVSAAALSSADDCGSGSDPSEDVWYPGASSVLDYVADKFNAASFLDELLSRRKRFGVDDASLSAAFRRERMLEGIGS